MQVFWKAGMAPAPPSPSAALLTEPNATATPTGARMRAPIPAARPPVARSGGGASARSRGIVEERHVADAGVEHLALELHAALLERAPSRLDIVHVQGDRVAVDMMRGSRPVGARQCYAAA
jgi:hypothetical protein